MQFKLFSMPATGDRAAEDELNLMLLLRFGECETENAVLRRASSVHPNERREPGNGAVGQFGNPIAVVLAEELGGRRTGAAFRRMP